MARKGTLTKTITLPDGSRKWIYAKTQEELDRKLHAFHAELNLGLDIKNTETFGEFAQKWYKLRKEPNLRDSSKASILNALNTHILPVISGYRLRDITPLHLDMVFSKITEKSASLNRQVKTVLNEILNTAVDSRIIPRNPLTRSVHVGGVKTKEKAALTPEQETEVLDALKQSSIDGARQAWLFVLVGLKTGLRRGELCGLMWSDIDFEKAELTVAHNCTWPRNVEVSFSSNLKTDAAYRTVPLPNAALAALTEERARSTSLYVFHCKDGSPMTYSAFRRLWDHVRRLKMPNLTAHLLRHTYCTRIIETGMDIKAAQYLMGHSSPEMTLRVYAHYCSEARKATTAEKIRAAL